MSLLASVFDEVINFFNTIGSYITFDILMYAGLGVLALLVAILIIQVKHSFEIKMVKTIDGLNSFLTNNPKITDDNLVAFNNKMKKAPHSLRIQWQQFMLYREGKPSSYLSFKNCVENPMTGNSYKQTLRGSAMLAGVLIAFLMLFGVFAQGGIITDLSKFAKYVLLLPLCIGIIYAIIYIFVTARLSAITADLFNNFQYFEKNIDKATTSLPDYVDYEVLFSKKEIRQGIPVLFEYLEKRAQVEQQELQRAREKNVEHEKYNFDKAGIESSLVLDRAMSEAERYLSDRNKIMQEIEQRDNEITSLQSKFKEYTKEYQRKMQASKENVERLKTQLDQAASNIEANYIKKQYSDEINRQQLLEKEFDAKNQENKQNIAVLQQDISERQEQIDSLRGVLENSMMSEFDTYSKKVYDKVEDAVNKQQQKRMQNIDSARVQAEERLAEKERELEQLYEQYHTQTERLDKRNMEYSELLRERNQLVEENNAQIKDKKKKGKKDIINEPITPKFDEEDVLQKSAKTDDIAPVDDLISADNVAEPEDNSPVTLPAKDTKPVAIDPIEDDILANDQPKDILAESEPEVKAEPEKAEEPIEITDDILNDKDEPVDPFTDINDIEDKKEPELPLEKQGIMDDMFDKSNDEDLKDVQEKVKNVKDYKEKVINGTDNDQQANEATLRLREMFLNRNKPQGDDDNAPKSKQFDAPAEPPKTETNEKKDVLADNDDDADYDDFDFIFDDEKDDEPKPSIVSDMIKNEPNTHDNADDDQEFDFDTADETDESKEEPMPVEVKKPAGKRGRPKKNKVIVYTIKQGRGRPKKTDGDDDNVATKPAGRRGRPKKESTETKPKAVVGEKKGRGRPKKETSPKNVDTVTATENKSKGRGRPKKAENTTAIKAEPKAEKKQGRGRPKKDSSASTTTKPAESKSKGRGRPKKETTEAKPKAVVGEKKGRGRPKKETSPKSADTVTATENKSKGRGRPKKTETLDEQLKSLNDKIVKENRQLDAQRAALELEIKNGFDPDAIKAKQAENEEKRRLLDSILSQLDILSSSAQVNTSASDKETIQNSINYLNDNFNKINKKK